MTSLPILELNERLVKSELELNIGSRWFESWLELLVTNTASLDNGHTEVLKQLAQRLDNVILAQSTDNSDTVSKNVETLSEKRKFESVQSESEQVLDKKKPTESQVVHVEGSDVPVEDVASIEVPIVATSILTSAASTEETQSNEETKVLQEVQKPAETEVIEHAEILQDNKTEEVTPPAEEPIVKKEEPAEAPKPSSKLSAFLAIAEPVTTPVQATSSKAPSSPSKTVVSAGSSSVSSNVPSSPSPVSAKAPSSPSSVSAKVPSSPTAAPTKAPSSPSTTITNASSSRLTTATVEAALSPSASASETKPSFVSEAASLSSPSSDDRPVSPSSAAKQQQDAVPAVSHKPEAQQTEGGHMVVPDECYDVFQEIKIRKKHRYAIFKIENWRLELVKIGPKTATFDDFMKELPFSECRYIVYDHERLKEDQYGSRMAAKVFFITWQPVPAPTQFKMLYSTERRILSQAFKGVEDIVAVKRDDVMVAVGAKGKFDEEESEDEERGGKDDWMDD
jgi:cofilin